MGEKSRKLLAVFAHPDDESFTVGGTLAKYTAEGAEVILVSATKGEAGIPGLNAAEAARIREAELRAAAAELGVREVRFLGYPDGALASIDPNRAVARLMELLRELRPQVIITFGPDGISGHPDHVTVSRWVTTAFEMMDGADAPRKLYYIAPSLATQQGCGVAASSPLPEGAVGIDVSAYLEAKVRAMQAHASQSPPYSGDPAEEARRLACHEWFVLARSRLPSEKGQDADLFTALEGTTGEAGST